MRTPRHRLATATATASVALVLLLAGCSGGSGNTSSESAAPAASAAAGGASSAAPEDEEASTGEQSKADACALVQDSFQEFSTVSAEMDASNPQGAVDTFKALSDKTTASLSSITNTEVKPAATEAATALGDYVTYLETVVSDPSQASGMSEQVTALQEGFTEVGTICAG